MMKNEKNKFFGAVFTVGMTVFCIICTESVRKGVSDALERCVNVLIPSLYAMMIAASLITKTGILTCCPKWLKRFGSAIFGMSGTVYPIFLISSAAGYPVGAKLLAAESGSGRLSKRRASVYAGVCFGAGPAFISGCIASQLYGSREVGRLIFVSCTAANVLLALIVSVKTRCRGETAYTRGDFGFSAEKLVESVNDGGRAMLGICAMTAAFSVFAQLLSELGVIGFISEKFPVIKREYLLAILDVTAVGEFPRGDYSMLPVICGLVSFGGICVMLQICALTAGKLEMPVILGMRIAAAALGGIICKVLMSLFGDRFCVTASAVRVCSEHSALPSVMLILMTLILLRECSAMRRKK